MNQTELEKALKQAQDAYYKGEPIMSDIEFDRLWDELEERFPDSILLREVGADHTNGFRNVKHTIIMGSQAKANTAEDMNKYFSRNGKGKYLAQNKCDGCSIALNYTDGKFVSGVTRGDGKTGDDITQNVLKMQGLVRNLTESYTGTVRGEVLLDKETKAKYFPDMKNCRNAAAGIMKHLDGADCEKLTIRVYDAQYLDKTKSFRTQENLQSWLQQQGFIVADWQLVDTSRGFNGAEAIKLIKHAFTEEAINNRAYDIDGIVFKKNDIDMHDIQTEVRPKTMIALKNKYTLAVTTIEGIDWSVKNGTLTPVAIVSPCEIDGTTVKRASLANISCMEELGIEIGHKIIITKAGMIIPKILKDLTTGKFASGYEF